MIEILVVIKDTVIQQQLYDPKIKQWWCVIPDTRYTNKYTIAATHPAEFFARHIIQLVNITSSLFVSQEARFALKPNLLTILRTECQNQDKEKRIFKYKEIVELFSSYVIKRKDTPFHPDNHLVAWVDLDPPLGLALGGISRLELARPTARKPVLLATTIWGETDQR